MYAKCIQYLSRINEYVQIGSVEITPGIYEIRIKSAQIFGPSVDSIQILFFLRSTPGLSFFQKLLKEFKVYFSAIKIL